MYWNHWISYLLQQNRTQKTLRILNVLRKPNCMHVHWSCILIFIYFFLLNCINKFNAFNDKFYIFASMDKALIMFINCNLIFLNFYSKINVFLYYSLCYFISEHIKNVFILDIYLSEFMCWIMQKWFSFFFYFRIHFRDMTVDDGERESTQYSNKKRTLRRFSYMCSFDLRRSSIAYREKYLKDSLYIS